MTKASRTSWDIVPEPLYVGHASPGCGDIFSDSGEWLTLTDWPEGITPTTAKGLAKANVWASFIRQKGNFRFSGFHTTGYSLRKRREAGAIFLHPLYMVQACIPGSSRGYAIYCAAPNRPILIRPLVNLATLAAIMPVCP